MMISRKALCTALLAATVAQACLMASPASAQTAQVAFNLPAQDLATTLRAIACEARREILFAEADVRGRRSPAVRGRFTVEQAVRLTLGGSDLVVEQQAGALIVKVRLQATQDSTEEEAITVTGTRIRGATGTSPITILTRRGLEEQGIPDMASVSRIIPQNFTGGQNPGVAGGGDQGGYNNINNATTLNLRGLGSDATLTLINGHRLPYDAVNQGVDISIIPLAALDRIKVITDGASALYGSDAVGGVANLLLRRDFDGLQTSGRVGASTQGGNVQQQYSGVGGKRWAGGGFMAALDYSKATPIYADDRPYTRQINAAQMLGTGSRQVSSVLAGHQDLASWASFELDAQFADRRSHKTNAFSLTAPVTFHGQVNLPIVRTYAVTPSLHLRPGAGWEATLQITDGESSSVSNSRRYTNGNLLVGRSAYDNHLTNFEASAEGPLVHLPGGDVRLAAGGGYRRFQLDFDVRTTSAGITRVTRDAVERRQSLFGYGELSVPLVGPANRMPLVEALRLSAAARYENYKGMRRAVVALTYACEGAYNGVSFCLRVGIFLRLIDLPDPIIMEIITVVMGETLASGSAAVAAVGTQIGVDMADWWQADAAFFELIRDREVLSRIAAEVAGETVATANRQEKTKTLKRIVSDHLDGADGRTKVERWVPKWLDFPASAYTSRGGVRTVAAHAKLEAARTPEPDPDTEQEPLKQAA